MNYEIVPQAVGELRKILGDVVFLPCNQGEGGKGPILKGFQRLTRDQMTPDHIAHCEQPEYRIGVLLGRSSGHLCSLDCDENEFAEEMFRLNPWVRNTLATTCNRGCAIWLRVNDLYPGTFHLYWKGIRVGEWRSNGGQSIIAGCDQDTGNYRRFVHRTPVVSVSWVILQWPDGMTYGSKKLKDPWPPLPSDAHARWAGSTHPMCREVIPHTPTGERDVERAMNVERSSRSASSPRARSTSGSKDELPEKERKQKRLCRELVRHIKPSTNRNALLNQQVPFLIHAVAEPLIISFLLTYYDEQSQACGWNASRDEHEKSITSLIRGCLESYPKKLSPFERGIYESLLDEQERAAFRITRDLAVRDDPAHDCPPGLFIMAYGELAARLNCTNKRAVQILKGRFLTELEIVKIDAPGIRRSRGIKGKATRWKLLIPQS